MHRTIFLILLGQETDSSKIDARLWKSHSRLITQNNPSGTKTFNWSLSERATETSLRLWNRNFYGRLYSNSLLNHSGDGRLIATKKLFLNRKIPAAWPFAGPRRETCWPPRTSSKSHFHDEPPLKLEAAQRSEAAREEQKKIIYGDASRAHWLNLVSWLLFHPTTTAVFLM